MNPTELPKLALKLGKLSAREQKRIAILTAMGYKDVEPHPSAHMDGRLRHRVDGNWQWMNLDPFTDLNACHEMEKVLVGDLEKLHNDPMTYRRWHQYRALLEDNIHATAEIRAEAFGQTLGLW